MRPHLPMPAFGILTHEKIIAPSFIIDGFRRGRARNERLAAVAELFLFTSFAAVRTEQHKHRVVLNLVSDAGGAVLIDEMPRGEAFEIEGPIELMRLVVCNRVSKDVPRTRRSLEPARPPPAIEVEALDLRLADNRAC